MNYYPEGKIPFVWLIDDVNIFIINSYRHRAPLCLERVKRSSKSALSFVNYIINSINQNIKVSLPFCVNPQYEKAGLSVLKNFDSSLMGNHLKGLHREFQDWLRRYGNSCEVVVHGWDHYNPDYLSDGSWDTLPGADNNRRSEWYKHPDPVRLFERCVKALTNLGYTVETSVFSIPGSRVDAETLRKLRLSKYKVIGRYCTQPESFPVDFQQPISGKPVYLKSIDVLIFPSGLRPTETSTECPHGWLKPTDILLKEIEALIKNRIGVIFLSHGYEPAFNQDNTTVEVFEFLERNYHGQVVYMTMSEYAKFLHHQVSSMIPDTQSA